MEEKTSYYAQAKASLQNGDETGAEHYLTMVQLKENEYQQNLKMVRQYQTMAAAVKKRGDEQTIANEAQTLTPVIKAQISQIDGSEKIIAGFGQASDGLGQQENIEFEEKLDRALYRPEDAKGVEKMKAGMLGEVRAEGGPDNVEFQRELDEMYLGGEIDGDQKVFLGELGKI
jgi:hypothetical protein